MSLFHIKSLTMGDGTNTDIVRPSDWLSAHSQIVTLSGNTAGVSTVSGTNIVYQGGNNIVASGVQGANAATIIFSGSNQSVQTQASGNIAGIGYTSTTQAGSTVGATQNTAGLSMAWPPFLTTAQAPGAYLTTARASTDAVGLATAQTNVTWTVNSAGLSLNAGGYAGTTTGFTGANISGSMTHNSAGLALSLSAAAGGGGADGFNIVQIGTTGTTGTSFSSSNGTVFFNGSNNITVSQNNSNQIVIVGPNLNQFLTTAAQSSVSNVSGILAATNNTGGGTATLSGNISFSNANGVSFFTSAGNAVVATVATNYQSQGAYLTTARGSTDAIGLGTAQTNVTWTVNSAGLSFNAGGYAGTTTGFTGANISGSMTHNTAGLALSLSVAAPGGGGAINVSAGTTSGNLQTIVFSNSNGVSFGLNGSTVTASAAGGGGGAYTQAFFQPELYGSSLTSTLANGTVYIRPFELNSPIDADKYMFQAAYTTLTSTRSLSGGASGVLNIGATGSYGMTGTVLMMSRVNTNETNASYNSIVSFDSKTFSMGNGYTFSQSQSTNVSSATVSYSSTYGASFIQNIGSDGGFTTTATTASSTGSFSSTSTGAGTFGSSISLSAPNAYFSGIRPWLVPGSGTVMPGGEYWLGLIITTNTGSTGSYSLNAAVQLSAPAIQFMTASTNNYLEIGNSVPFTTSNWRPGFGSISATASSLTSGNIALSQISNMASNASMYFAIQGQTK